MQDSENGESTHKTLDSTSNCYRNMALLQISRLEYMMGNEDIAVEVLEKLLKQTILSAKSVCALCMQVIDVLVIPQFVVYCGIR